MSCACKVSPDVAGHVVHPCLWVNCRTLLSQVLGGLVQDEFWQWLELEGSLEECLFDSVEGH